MTYAPDRKANRLLPDLTPYPPSEYRVVMHPDVQLTTEEWLELADYEKVESAALAPPGVVAFQARSAQAVVPLVVGRMGGIA